MKTDKPVTKKEFLQAVADKVKAIKKTATINQIKKLNFADLNPESRQECIYGQMCDDCNSSTAKKLIFNCCKRYVNGISEKNSSFTKIKNRINGIKVEGVNTFNNLPRGWITNPVYSSLENYICLKGAKNKHIIDYLQGKVKKLVL